MGSDSSEFQDWEVLQSNSDSDSGFGGLDEIDAHSYGGVQANYFSLESGEGQFPKSVSEESSESSENPGWLEPESEIQSPTKESAEFRSDSGSIGEGGLEFSESGGTSEVGLVKNEKLLMGFEGIEEISSENGTKADRSVKAGEFDEHTEQSLNNIAGSETDSNVGGENLDGNVEVETRNVQEAETKTVVWWKVPLELLKYCVFRVNPVWTFSLAAAAMGFVILGRRLYNMKKRTRSLQLKVTMDDKKVSQFMSRAARLNEAFSVVKRVPVIRPGLPAVGVTPWPVMSLR